ncbi:MAG: hypothetical protein KDA25_07885 [Phycisphaerales bacterium]|nr:hypothetical protein [Phycisphaerales bacterium]
MPACPRLLLAALALVGAASLGGCNASRSATFPDASPAQVWTAAKAVAETPDYDDWVLLENQVWVDEPTRRVEIFRHLRRDRWAGDLVKPHRDDRSFAFRVALVETEPPTIEMTSRGWGVPAHAWPEFDRYFDAIRSLLAGAPQATLDADAE